MTIKLLLMSIRRAIPFGIMSVVLFLAACSSAETQQRTVIIRGEIVIQSDDADVSDFSGTHLSIVNTRSESRQDTVLSVRTDVDGRFSVVASVDERGVYPLVISRNNRVLHLASIVLAPGDTVSINGSIPELNRTIRVQSIENSAMETYERLQRLYGRVATFAYGGRVDADTIPGLMNQWSDYFWSLRTEYPGTYAADLGSIDAIEILEGWNDRVTMERIEQLGNNSLFIPVKTIYGGHVRARIDGIDAGLKYLDDLRNSVRDVNEKISADMRKIELLVDYAEFDRALQELEAQTRRNRSDAEFIEWAGDVRYELENLIPGREIPDFNIALSSTETISKESLKGQYFMLEVVLLADGNYQAAYPELLNIRSAAPVENLVFYTVPLDNSQVTINAFFEERTRRWTFADAGSLDRGNILDVLRIDQVPTRYLVGPDSRIISRYITHDVSGLRHDIQNLGQN